MLSYVGIVITATVLGVSDDSVILCTTAAKVVLLEVTGWLGETVPINKLISISKPNQ